MLPVVSMVVSESMRLYPPAWVLGRRSIEADTLGGYSIPADAPIGIYPYMIHRHPDFWSRPDEFNPEFGQRTETTSPAFNFVLGAADAPLGQTGVSGVQSFASVQLGPIPAS